jgi:hypothetical protein
LVTVPSAPMIWSTTWGLYSVPPFASAQYALSSWIGVTAS